MKIRTLALAALMSATGIFPAYAEEAEAPAPIHSFSGTLTFVSDYVFRGITQNNEHPAVQGSFDYEHISGLYAGIWGSSVDFQDGGITSTEIDIYGGYRFPVGTVNLDAGLNGVIYPGSSQNVDHYNYIEGKISAEKDFGFADLTAQLAYSPEYFARSGPETYIGLNGTVPLASSGFDFLASIGHQWIDDEATFGVPDYMDWSAGLGYSWQGFDFALKYTDTNLSKTECADGCEGRAVFSIARTL